MEIKREIIFFGDYFEDFFNTLDSKTQDKVDEILYFVSILDIIPAKYLKKIVNTEDLYEIRLESNIGVTFAEYSVVSMMINWLFYSMVFKRKLKKHLKKKSKKLKEL